MKYKILSIITIAATLFGGEVKAVKDTICLTIRPSGAQGVNAEIGTQNTTANFGSAVDFFSATWTCGGNCIDRSLIQFNLSSIPSNATILSASVSLYTDNVATEGITGQPTYGTNNAGWFQRVTSAWNPATVTWATQPTTTTVNEVALAQSINSTENYTVNVTQLVKDIISSGNNYGFELLQQNETTPYNSLIFGSSYNADSTIFPKFNVCYVVDVTPGDSACVSLRPYDTNGTVLGTQSPNSPGIATNLFYSATWTCNSNCLDRGLIRFDLSSLPVNATITNASLSLYADNSATIGITGQPTYGTNNAGWLQRITSAWTYNTVTWNTLPTTTTADEVQLAQSINTSENYVLNVTQLIKDIMSSGNNYGFELLQQNETTPYQSLVFGSSANADSTLRPKLDICYTTPSSIAEVTNPNINIQVYPNPAKDEIVFKTNSSESMKNYHVEMYNVIGQEVRNFQLYPYLVTINTSDLERGMYFYKIVGSNIVVKSGKIVLQ
jgi:hypothetical protein